MSPLSAARPVRFPERATRVEALRHAPRRTCDYDGVQSQDGDRRGTTDLRATLADRGVPPCLDQRALRLTAVPVPEPPEGSHGSHLGLSQLQPDQVVQHTTQAQSGNSVHLRPRTGKAGSSTQLISPRKQRDGKSSTTKLRSKNPISSQLPYGTAPILWARTTVTDPSVPGAGQPCIICRSNDT